MFDWLVQGVIVAVSAFVGVYAALWLYARRQTGSAHAETEADEVGFDGAPNSPFVDEAEPEVDASGLAITASAPPANHGLPGARNSPPAGVQHLYAVGDDRVTLTVEMPAAYLEDDAILGDIWAEAVARARESGAAAEGDGAVAASADPAATGEQSNGSSWKDAEHLEAQLDEALRRLQLAAAQRGQLPSHVGNDPAGVPSPGA